MRQREPQVKSQSSIRGPSVCREPTASGWVAWVGSRVLEDEAAK